MPKTCTCPACREPNTVTLTADGVPLPTASTPPRVRVEPVEVLPPGWEEWSQWEGENV